MRKLFVTSMAIVALAGASQMQARTISGTVIEAGTNEPCIGATVMPIGGGQGAATDIDGKFTINVPDNVKTAKVSYVGYKERVVTLSPGMRVELTSTTSNLDEVVVVAYGTATKESLTGSVSVVGAKEIEDRPVTSVTQALEGNAPGVQVNSTTSAPGSAPTIRIRGFGTFTGTSNPMYVVDGVPFDGSISDLNPADIESMTVLKDAASCALYGVRGSNGVILITTKRAKSTGHAEVTLQVREGMYTRGLPEYDKVNTDQWMEMMFATAATNLMKVQPNSYPTRDLANAYQQESFVSGSLGGQNIYNLPGTELFDANGKLLGHVLPGYLDDLDWWNAVHRTGFRQEYNLNIAAASDKYNLFASIGYLNEKGYLLKTDFERFNARFNVNFQPTTYFRGGVNVSASYQTQESNPNAGTSNMVNPFTTQFYAPIYPYYAHYEQDVLGADGQILHPAGAVIYDENGKPEWNMRGQNDNRNVAFELRKNFTEYNGLLVDANAFATAIIPYGFELTLRGNMSRNFSRGLQYQNNLLGDAFPDGRLSTADSQYRYHTFLEQLNWAHRYGANQEHSVDVLLAHENSKYYSVDEGTSMSNQMEDDYYANDNFAKIVSNPTGSYSEARSESYLGRVRYNYDDRYFVEASIRRDGADRFAKDNRWGTFWSVGGSWIISKEAFMRNATCVDYLKFRVAYGSVGNYLSAPSLSWASMYGMTTSVSNTPMMVRSSLGNPNLTWEAQKTFDIGVEGSLFHNRLNAQIGYFDKTSDNLIFSLPGAPSTGYMIGSGSALHTPLNLGKLANRGWEISLNGVLVRNANIEWGLSLDMTFLKNKILSLPYNNRDMNNGTQRLSVGRSIYEWYCPTWVGVDQMTGSSLYEFNKDEFQYQYGAAGNYTQDELDKLWKTEVENATNDHSLVTINGKTYATKASYGTDRWHGTAVPTVYGSFGTTLAWKGIHLGILFTYSLGGKTMDSTYESLMSVNGFKSAYHKDALNAWIEVPAGMTETSPNRINPDGVPINCSGESQDNNFSDSRFLTSSSWLVFKNVNLSYDLPKNWAKALQMQNINVGFSADNLFTVAARKGLNPQQTYSGVQTGTSDGTFVTSRVFSFQLTCKF